MVCIKMSDTLKQFLMVNVTLEEEIGRGGSGVVYKGKWQGVPCAVKKMEMLEIPIKDRELMRNKFMEECKRSSSLRHPNIVQFLGVHIRENEFPSLVMELLHSNLTDLMQENPKIPLDMKFSFIHDVAKGLNYLHTYTPTIIHRDLSSNNVFVSAGMVAKIGDMGTVRFVDERLSGERRTSDFMPPEVLFSKPIYSTAMDVFSFACICLHMLSHQWPSPSEPVVIIPVTYELRAQSEVERRAAYMEGMDGRIKAMVTCCLNNIAERRPSIDDVCDHLEYIVTKQQFARSPTLLEARLSTEQLKGRIDRGTEVSLPCN